MTGMGKAGQYSWSGCVWISAVELNGVFVAYAE